ncbi:restriction endonuclease subunit S [Psychrobacter maritimus]|uniref:restriction endonuclease subunit S n=1 Tax=Psychrobacter maritimus TaxID=256325 RepID=UPI00248C7758|nr:restriction endonuclease subunit S [Psychrobacter sp. WB2]WGV12399.1 restriction endonuclease subunit S [Psychrobacter sp. WB2]
MASDWDTYPISDFVTLSQGLAINAKSKYLLEETGLPLLRITDLINGTQVHFVNEEKAPPKCIATDHELIYTRTGQVGLVYRNKVGVVHNNCFKVIPSPELDKDFLYWFLFQESTKAHVNAVASGSVQKDLNHAAFLTLSIPKPELSEQKAIASILDSLDDKIELNRQMNETLEAMAQALFKSWFVDFDPVIDNALAAGNTIPDEFSERAEQRKGIEKKDDSDIQDLFPDEFEFTEEMGWIPKGWGISEVKDFGQVVCGKTPSKKKAEYYGNDISFIKIPDMHDVAWATTTTDNLSFEGSNSQKNKLIPKGSICVSCIATVGKVLITSREAHTNQQINSVIPAEKNTLYYLYSSFLAMNRPDFIGECFT